MGVLGYSCKIHRKRSKSSVTRLSLSETDGVKDDHCPGATTQTESVQHTMSSEMIETRKGTKDEERVMNSRGGSLQTAPKNDVSQQEIRKGQCCQCVLFIYPEIAEIPKLLPFSRSNFSDFVHCVN